MSVAVLWNATCLQLRSAFTSGSEGDVPKYLMCQVNAINHFVGFYQR